jgi:hypothetical protein
MEIKFTVTKEERKALVAAVADITGWASVYKGAPSFAFAVSNYTIDRYGTIVYDERTDAEDARVLLLGLIERGFVFEGDIDEIAPGVPEHDGIVSDSPVPDETVSDDLTKREGIPDETENNDSQSVNSDIETESSDCMNETASSDDTGTISVAASDGGSDKLSINMPLFGFTASSIDNVYKLVTAKAWILKKMAGTDELPIKKDDKYLYFPWFKKDASAAEVDAYSRLIAGLCETAKKKQRVTATERQLEDGDNEKFKARCFLLSLDFIGEQYIQARKILLAPMSGSGSHKSGGNKRPGMSNSAKTAGNGEENVEAAHARVDDSGADNAVTGGATAACDGEAAAQVAVNITEPLNCGECFHHCYYTDGDIRTSSGETVDISSRKPEKYTHYCLGTPNGFRRIKHAVDWSGSEAPASWCPLKCAKTTDGSDEGAVDNG